MPRPRSPLLSAEAIVTTALELIDTTGNFSFPRIARELEVSQSSLYNHIQNREHIIELIRARVFSEKLQLPVQDLPWDEALRAVVRAYRRCIAAHPRLVPLILAQTVQDTGALAAYETMALALEQAGLPPNRIVSALSLIDNLVLGSVMELTAPAVVWAPPPGDFPALDRALQAPFTIEGRAEAAFELGLEVLIEGLRAQEFTQS
ncbi:TetR/AcrR family transcriptional regulator C-terminal domain-containing protein [Arthrobacter caoxuetaonis]|uniref:TetR/AcrR family transcriptional regulator C-terminal domain-containing protein n=1 Tax=Arthrobacter caoxuetaonis TaxID=2886935 RepID=UPI001D13A3AB|nr:TetR/AcrR family transcriptional regulator C-terminal domain-containing protein [Arthrobacter caoxuetaonis]MCC3282094.1 TetR/AcrR family transcriptional regulator [Arthrobacter caoxuetaonis]